MRQAAWKSIMTLVLVMALTACGFHLRGTAMVSDALSPLALSCGNGVPEPVCSGLRDRLGLYNILAEDHETAGYHLKLRDYQQERRTSALDERAAASEYELSARMAVALTTEDGIPLLADTELSAREFYQADEQQVLAGEREQQGIEGLLQDQLIQQVTRRLMPFTEERINRIRSEHESTTDAAE
ncbi:LPS assembly lipoprotein LptE [Salicola sp. Rm-C-2C1-2]|uniref:LPS-assembly lipoprotein LptE n=1 Tax=Salicola sp. Rm-C-2C1-2 TaxID=3141321 RepID=UPI0032E3CED1